MKKNISIICISMLLIVPILSTTAMANEPPEAPTIDGPTKGAPLVEYDYIFMSVDPDGDDVYYYVSWGCCGPGRDYHKYGPFESGIETTISKTYDKEGDFVISAYAEDINEAASDIATLDVSMPVYRSSFYNILLGFLEHLMNRFPLFNALFGL